MLLGVDAEPVFQTFLLRTEGALRRWRLGGKEEIERLMIVGSSGLEAMRNWIAKRPQFNGREAGPLRELLLGSREQP